MANRVEQITLQVRKLAQATGVEVQKKEFNEKDAGLDGVTSDLDIEALSKGLLDTSRDLDLYLQGLLGPPDLPVVALKAVRHALWIGRRGGVGSRSRSLRRHLCTCLVCPTNHRSNFLSVGYFCIGERDTREG